MHKVKIRGGRAEWDGRAPAHDVNDEAAAVETDTVRVKKGTYTPKQWVDPDGFPPLKNLLKKQSTGQFKNDDSDGGDDGGGGGGGGGGGDGDDEGNGGDGGDDDRRARGGPVPWWKCDAIDVAIMGPG